MANPQFTFEELFGDGFFEEPIEEKVEHKPASEEAPQQQFSFEELFGGGLFEEPESSKETKEPVPEAKPKEQEPAKEKVSEEKKVDAMNDILPQWRIDQYRVHAVARQEGYVGENKNLFSFPDEPEQSEEPYDEDLEDESNIHDLTVDE